MDSSKKMFELGYDFSHIVPVPADPTCTTYVPAGAVSIGVEYRSLDGETQVETIADDGTVSIKSVELVDRGVSLHVCEASSGDERLRFDAFDDDPHYHYINPGVLNRLVVFDGAANGDMTDWAMRAIRHQLPEMLVEADASELAGQVDQEVVAGALEEVARLVATHLGSVSEPAPTSAS